MQVLLKIINLSLVAMTDLEKMLHTICISAVAVSLGWGSCVPWVPYLLFTCDQNLYLGKGKYVLLDLGPSSWTIQDTIMKLHRWILMILLGWCVTNKELQLAIPFLNYLSMVKICVRAITPDCEMQSWNFINSFIASGWCVLKKNHNSHFFQLWVIRMSLVRITIQAIQLLSHMRYSHEPS